MKKIFFLFALMCTMLSTQAQEFKPFKLGLGAGVAVPSGSGSKSGLLYYLEPAYRVNDQIAVGLRIEGAVMARGVSEDVSDVNFTISANGSYTVNGQYYLSDGTFRPFVGLGLGLYSLASVSVDGGTGDVAAAESKFGFYPRLGFDVGHFTMNLEYNLIPKTTVESSTGDSVDIKNSYIGIKAGFFLFGGRN